MPLASGRVGLIERIAEFDEHVQGHEQAENMFAPRINAKQKKLLFARSSLRNSSH